MQFCPKCGRLMLPKKEKDRVVLVCSSCGHVVREEKVEGYSVVKRGTAAEDIVVVEDEVKTGLPTAKVRCPGCGHDRAYWWMRQTRSADEPTTRFYRCAKCGKVWREYT
ncbi:MAG: DNA-directed RNA polymerase subunit M [Candidatus Hadarchaeum yellowstonense]|jgi:DNA-directed RNA polymerase subunit M|uniref:Transcription factor S n=1 Tax=Hadarchaeum yellowstonense TaxID=1776334 RepID=A0A147JYU5_HADYE|nr:MAG: DNA-directed RNA polymerase subunit M [Candidatus Hadarchaeum yellowstonense]